MAESITSLRLRVDSTDIVKAEKDLNNLTKASGNAEKSAGATSTSFLSLNKVLASGAALGLAMQYVKLADTMTGVQSKLRLVTSSTQELTTAQEELFKIAQKTRQGYAETVDTYSNFALSMGEMGKSQKEILRVTETVNKAIAISGVTAQQAAAATMQLGQAFASGTLRGDELNSILENSKGLAKAIADGMGVPIGKLRSLGAEGKITAEVLATALEKSAQSVDEKFSKVGVTVGMSVTQIENALLDLVGTADQAMNGSGGITEVFSYFAEAMTNNKMEIIESGKDAFRALQVIGTGAIQAGAGMYTFMLSIPTALALAVDASSQLIENGVNNTISLAEDAANKIKSLYGGDRVKLGRVDIDTNISGGLTKHYAGMVDLLNIASDTQAGLFKDIMDNTTELKKIAPPSDKGSGKKGGAGAELTKEQIAAAKKAKAEAEKLAKEEAEIQKGYLEGYAELEKQAAIAQYELDVWYIEDLADRQSDVAIRMYEMTLTESQKLAEKVASDYDIAIAMFGDDKIPEEWFDAVNKKFEDLKENVSNMDFSASIEFDPQGLDGTAKAIAGIGKSTSALSKAEAQYQKNKAKTGATAEDLAENERQYTQDQLAGYSNMAGAMSAMFEEGSKEAEAFQAVQSGLAVISAVAAVMNAGTSGDGYTAVARMLAVAATATSFLSQIGKSLDGGGTSQSDIAAYTTGNTGTGTILGDVTAQSESISKSLDMLSDIAKPEFKLISEMNASLKSIDIKLGGTATNIVQRGGFATGAGGVYSSEQSRFQKDLARGQGAYGTKEFGIGGYNASVGTMAGVLTGANVTSYLMDKLFGGSSTTSTIGAGISFGPQNLQSAIDNLIGKSFQTVLTQTDGGWFGGDESSIYDTFSTLDSYTKTQFQLVLKDLYDVTDTAGEILGESVEGSLNSMIVNLGKISLMGKTGAQIQKALENVFSSVGDKMASKSLPLLKPFQAIGEGMFETMVRVSSGMEEAKYYTEKLGTEVIKYTEILDKSGDVGSEALRQSINIMDEAIYGIDNGVSLIIDSLSQGTDTIFETYKALSEMRFQITATNQDIRGLTSAMLYGAGGISELSDGLSTYIDSFLTEQEQLQYRTEVISAEFAKLGLSLPKSSAEFRSLVEGIDLTTEAGQKLYGGVIVLSDGFSELSASSEGIKSSLFDNIRAFISELNNELKTNDPSVSFYNFTSSFNEMVDAISNGADNLLEVGNTALDNAKSYLATVTATATAGRDIQFAKAMLVNKFSGVIAEPDVSLNTINNTLVSNNALLVQELQSLKFELTSIKNMTVDQRATTENSLTTLRGILGSVAV